jgi:GDP-L-fucose synthase
MRIELDLSKPDGMPRKLLDVSRLHALGWRHRVGLREGIASTYGWFVEQLAAGAVRGVTNVRGR